MAPFFIYLLQVNIALIFFYLLYLVLLRRDTFLRIRRLFFLSVIVFSLLYPLWSVPALGDLWVAPTTLGEVEGTVLMGESGMEIAEENKGVMPTVIPWGKIVGWVYMIVTILFLIRFVIQMLSIFRIMKSCEKCLVNGIPVYQLKEDITPFSFFNLIFIHSGKHSEAELSQILLHEQVHVRQGHSIDIMLIEFVSLFSWWNPFVWLMRREMAMNLEYLADDGVLHQGVDSREYQYHLLRLTYQDATVRIVNNFNVSQLKQRIMMMNKARSQVVKLPKYLLVLPLFFVFVMLNSSYATHSKNNAAEIQSADDTLLGFSREDRETHPNTQRIAGRKVAKEKEMIRERRAQEVIDLANKNLVDADGIYVNYDEWPRFPGGNAAMAKFLADNVKYPKAAKGKGIAGDVVCSFVVEMDGRLTDFKVVRSVDPLLDNEAIRVLKRMPKWTPAKRHGEVVRVQYAVPVVFSLDQKRESEEI